MRTSALVLTGLVDPTGDHRDSLAVTQTHRRTAGDALAAEEELIAVCHDRRMPGGRATSLAQGYIQVASASKEAPRYSFRLQLHFLGAEMQLLIHCYITGCKLKTFNELLK